MCGHKYPISASTLMSENIPIVAMCYSDVTICVNDIDKNTTVTIDVKYITVDSYTQENERYKKLQFFDRFIAFQGMALPINFLENN
jgi:dolichyl-phosphate-mannose--protein O-mannosyl transferase